MPQKLEFYRPGDAKRANDFDVRLWQLDDPDATYYVIDRHIQISKVEIPYTGGYGLHYFGNMLRFRVAYELGNDYKLEYRIREKLNSSGELDGLDPVQLLIRPKYRPDTLLLHSGSFLQATNPAIVYLASKSGPVASRLDNTVNDGHGYPLEEDSYTISYESNRGIRVIPDSALKYHQGPYEIEPFVPRLG